MEQFLGKYDKTQLKHKNAKTQADSEQELKLNLL